MVILLLFNTSSQITFKELKETSGMLDSHPLGSAYLLWWPY
jgi:hypothetical protein